MKIVQVAPLYESVPPKLYGGTERVVSYLTEELVRRGHEVTLFASGDSKTRARLEAPCAMATRLDKNCVDPMASHILMMERVIQRSGAFDIIHFHIDYLHYSLSRRLSVPTVTTLHGRLNIPELVPLYDEFRDLPVVSISNDQRKPLPQARWVGTVYHGLPIDLFKAGNKAGSYLAFLGRVSPEKGLDQAIQIAQRVGMKLKIAAKVDEADKKYFVRKIRPMLDHPLIEFIHEIDDAHKNAFLAGARALLFPVNWPEPFGLAMIEAMACGTPVIAYRRGSVPEVIEDGLTGFVVENQDEAVEAVRKLKRFDRRACRARFVERFSASRMARDYLNIYDTLIRGTGPEPLRKSAKEKLSWLPTGRN